MVEGSRGAGGGGRERGNHLPAIIMYLQWPANGKSSLSLRVAIDGAFQTIILVARGGGGGGGNMPLSPLLQQTFQSTSVKSKKRAVVKIQDGQLKCSPPPPPPIFLAIC